MQFIQKIRRGIWYFVWYLFAAVIVLAAAVFGMARLLLPLVGDYNRNIEKMASEYLDQPVKIMSLEAEWHGISPSLILNNVQLKSKTGNDTLLLVSRVRMDFDLLAIIFKRRIEFSRLALSGANLSIVRKKNGQLRLAGFESGIVNNSSSVAGDEPSQLGLWILSQGEISVYARNLIFTDKINHDKKYNFSNITLKLWNNNDNHIINGSVEFVDKIHQEFEFVSELNGDFINTNNWSGAMYFHGVNINASRIFGVYNNTGNKISVGNSNFSLWSDWRDGRLVGIQGDVNFRDVRCDSEAGAIAMLAPLLNGSGKNNVINSELAIKNSLQVKYDGLAGQFDWTLTDYGWELLLNKISVSQGSKAWPKSDISMRYFNEKNLPFHYNLKVSQIKIDTLTPLLPVLIGGYRNYVKIIKKIAPTGVIKSINAAWSGDPLQYKFDATIINAGIADYGKFPGFEGLSGELTTDQHGGTFNFTTKKGNLYMPSVFRWDIPIRELHGSVDWAYDNNGLIFTSRDIELSTEHFESKAVFDITIPKSGSSPFISVITNFKNADVSKASFYFPTPIMGAKVLKWLDTGIVQGNVSSGAAIIYGPINEFPFTKGQGVFDVRFNVNDAILDYAENWPLLHSAQADVMFKGNQLKVKVKKAKLFDSDVSDTDVEIPDMSADKLQINVDGKVTGKTQNYLKYMLTAPPLAKRFRNALTDLQTTGNSNLDLKLNINIAAQTTADVSGKLKFLDNKLELSQIRDLLDHVNGEVSFDNGRITGKNIKALLLKQPSTISVNTYTYQSNTKRKKVSRTDYVAVGNFNVTDLSQAVFPFAANLFSGESAWKVKLTIPEGKPETLKEETMRITIDSNLKGVRFDAPKPFGKSKELQRNLNVSAIFRHNANTLLKLHYGDDVTALMGCDFSNKDWFERGTLHFGTGSAMLPKSAGMHISGTPGLVSYDEWKIFIQKLIAKWNQGKIVDKGTEQENENRNKKFAMLASMDIRPNQFIVFGQKFKNLVIKAENKGNRVAVNLNGSKVAGDITIPYNLNQKPIVLDMQRLNLSRIEESGEKLRVSDIPAIQFNGREVSYGDKILGKVAFETAKSENGLLLQQLIVKPRSTTIKGYGSWLIRDDKEQSEFNLDVDSDNIGNTMKDLGYVETISNGKGRITAKLRWPSGLIYPEISQLNGELSLKLRDGRILDIEPGGAARLFGLFSLQTLPRRLALDFSDIFSKGLGFDRISGNFNIDEGNAFTKDLKLLGTNADVSLKGRIGLATQDYDQMIKVTPHINDATVLLSIIANQPLLLLFQQLMKNDIDAATSFEYTLKGPWNKYELKPVLKKPPPATVPDDF